MTWRLIKILGCLLLWPGFSNLLAQNCDCKTTGNCPVMIQDYGTFKGTLNVTVDGPNDLGLCPLTKVCFSISHTWIGDLSVSLTSPNGTNYLLMADANNSFGGCGNNSDNVEVCIVPGNSRPLMNNKEYECNSGPCESGTCCLTGDWTVPCGGVIDSVAFAKQAPNCDLNDFNQPGAPANGTWTLTVNDMCVEDFGSLNNFSLYFGCGTVVCSVCKSDGGNLPGTSITSCLGSSNLNLNLAPYYASGKPVPDPIEYTYAYALVKNNAIINMLSSPDLRSVSAGDYRIYGFSYTKAASGQLQALAGWKIDSAIAVFKSSAAIFCGSFSGNFVPVSILPEPQVTTIDTLICEGSCVMIGGTTFCDSGQLKLKSWTGCDSIINVNITKLSQVKSEVSLNVCRDSCVTIAGKLYCLPGPHSIVLKTSSGCDSIITLKLNEVSTVAVISPPNPPMLTCQNLSTVLNASASSPANADYIWTGPGAFSSSSTTITVTTPGVYNLRVRDKTSGLSCGQHASVTIAGDLSRPNLLIKNPQPEICSGGSFDLATLDIEDENKTNPLITFHSGTPATAANKLSKNLLTPDSTTTYYVLATGTFCNDEKSVKLIVLPPISSNFTVQSQTCQDSSVSVLFTGNAGALASFNWNFSGGLATPGTGRGPHRVSWVNSPGLKIISLSLSENGCTAPVFSRQIEVQPKTAAPDIQCNPEHESLTFSWTNDSSLTYNVKVLSGPLGKFVTPNSYAISGLLSMTQSIIEVTSTGKGICPPTVTQATCVSLDCSSLQVNLTEPGKICMNSGSGSTIFKTQIEGSSASGKGSWSGPGITDSIVGIFETALAGPGKHNVLFTYTDGGCTVKKNLDIQVVEPPVADAGKEATLTCREDEQFAILGGNSSQGFQYRYLWKRNNEPFPGDSTVLNAKVYQPGTYTLTVFDTLNGCSATNSVEVFASQDTPVPELKISEITCFGKEDAAINVSAVNGGLSPYLFSLNGNPFSSTSNFQPLKPGTYTIGLLDAAGCQSLTDVKIEEGKQLQTEIIAHLDGQKQIKLGDSLLLEVYVNIPANELDLVSWEPSALVSCDTCLSTFAFPKETTTFKVLVQKSGCKDIDSKTIIVDKNYLIFAPTAFSPNGNGVNERFTIFSGPQVAAIRKFIIFDRWGEPVFKRDELRANRPDEGWDGTWRGSKMPAGVYSWIAEVEFIDGYKEIYDGAVNLVK